MRERVQFSLVFFRAGYVNDFVFSGQVWLGRLLLLLLLLDYRWPFTQLGGRGQVGFLGTSVTRLLQETKCH